MADITKHASGGTTFTGKGIELFRLLSLRSALQLQTKGIRMSSRLSATAAAQRMGFKGRTVKSLLPQVEAAIAELQPKVTRVEEKMAPPPPPVEKKKAMGLAVTVVRYPGRDCTNGGISSKVDMMVLVGPGIPEVDEVCEARPGLRLVIRWAGTAQQYMHAEPLEKPSGLVGPMMGGNFVHSYDHRFRVAVGDRPLAVHDRFETRESYNALSI